MPKVESSAVEAVDYSASLRELTVTFTGGARYAYAGVERNTYRELLKAESIGIFVNTVIKPNHPVRRLTARSARAPRSAA